MKKDGVGLIQLILRILYINVKILDFILGDGEVAVEVKGTSRVDRTDLKAIRAFAAEHSPRKCIVVCNEATPRQYENITILPWREFLKQLWAGEIL